jgi:hypothetical protein
MSDGKKNSLEIYMAAKFVEIDSKAHRTPGSGCGNSVGDIANRYCFVECKMKHTVENIIVQYENEWYHLLNQMPMHTDKFPVIATENKFGERFVTMSAEDFFKLLKEAKNDAP